MAFGAKFRRPSYTSADNHRQWLCGGLLCFVNSSILTLLATAQKSALLLTLAAWRAKSECFRSLVVLSTLQYPKRGSHDTRGGSWSCKPSRLGICNASIASRNVVCTHI